MRAKFGSSRIILASCPFLTYFLSSIYEHLLKIICSISKANQISRFFNLLLGGWVFKVRPVLYLIFLSIIFNYSLNMNLLAHFKPNAFLLCSFIICCISKEYFNYLLNEFDIVGMGDLIYFALVYTHILNLFKKY